MTSIGLTTARTGRGSGGPFRSIREWRAAIVGRDGWSALRQVALQAAVLLAVAVLTRIIRIGDPAINVDEQFYLLVGDRMWQGALPFVDIWDRKPVGLFLLYALFRPLSHDGIVAYQVAALLFAAATSLVLTRIAMRVAAPGAATVAGALYLIYLPIIGGAGGQSPVFYDLFTASAALLVVRCIAGVERKVLWRNGLAAMLLGGLAMQVKYMALFEGIAFGLTLLWLHWRTQPTLRSFAGYAASLVAMAVLPTALAFGVFAQQGHAEAFVSANFLSIFKESKTPGFSEVRCFLIPSALRMTPILLLSGLAATRAFACRLVSPTLAFALLWSAFAFVEFFAIGHYYDHYAIPLLMPLTIVVASLFSCRPFAFALPFLAVLSMVLSSGVLARSRILRDKVRIAALSDALSPYARKGCIYINDGPAILYVTTHSCLPTPYVFPSHLADADEAAATDAHASMAALLHTGPSAIVVADRPRVSPRNHDTDALLANALAASYHLAKTLPDIGDRNQLIYVRNDLR